jgi:hypothetical protein
LAIFEGPKFTGRVPVLVALIVWISEADDREKQKHYRAWELPAAGMSRLMLQMGRRC